MKIGMIKPGDLSQGRSEKSIEMILFEQEQLRLDREKAKKILDAILEKALSGMVTKTSGPRG